MTVTKIPSGAGIISPINNGKDWVRYISGNKSQRISS